MDLHNEGSLMRDIAVRLELNDDINPQSTPYPYFVWAFLGLRKTEKEPHSSAQITRVLCKDALCANGKEHWIPLCTLIHKYHVGCPEPDEHGYPRQHLRSFDLGWN